MRESHKKVAIGGGISLLALFALSRIVKRPEAQAPQARVLNSAADVAERELERWHGIVETDPAALPILREYWASTGQAFPGVDIPWSGAFITHVVNRSNESGGLYPSAAHIFYARRAYLNRGVPGQYGAYRPEEVAVQPGDILLRRRPGGEYLTFADLQSSGPMIPTHADIVTAVGPELARAIGGNLGGEQISAVKSRPIPHAGGVVTDPDVVAVLRYQPAMHAV